MDPPFPPLSCGSSRLCSVPPRVPLHLTPGSLPWFPPIPGEVEGTYVVEDANGKPDTVNRVDLRLRKLHTEVFVGATGDKKHDTYSMRHFSERELESLHSRHIFEKQKITVIRTHSDNAAQHFKSSNTLLWYSSLGVKGTPGRFGGE